MVELLMRKGAKDVDEETNKVIAARQTTQLLELITALSRISSEDQIVWNGDPDRRERQATLERFTELINGDGGAVEGFANERVLSLLEELLQHRFHFVRKAVIKALDNQGARKGLARACDSGAESVRRIARSIGTLLAVPQQHRP